MAAFPIQLIVKIVEVQNKLCLIFVYNNWVKRSVFTVILEKKTFIEFITFDI